MIGAVRPLRTDWPLVQGGAGIATLGLSTTLAIWAQRQLAEEWRAGVEASDQLVTADHSPAPLIRTGNARSPAVRRSVRPGLGKD